MNIPHDYKNIDTSPKNKTCLCSMALTGIIRAIGFVLFVATMYATICVLMSY